MTSFTLRGALGTPPALIAIATVVIAQLAFTYAPFMHELFQTRPVPFFDGCITVAAGVLLMVILETEKNLLRRFRFFGLGP